MAPKMGVVGPKSGFSRIPENPDFGIRISGTVHQLERERRLPTKFQLDPISRLASRVITDRQTDRQANRHGGSPFAILRCHNSKSSENIEVRLVEALQTIVYTAQHSLVPVLKAKLPTVSASKMPSLTINPRISSFSSNFRGQ